MIHPTSNAEEPIATQTFPCPPVTNMELRRMLTIQAPLEYLHGSIPGDSLSIG